jgi:hypothetical protein
VDALSVLALVAALPLFVIGARALVESSHREYDDPDDRKEIRDIWFPR